MDALIEPANSRMPSRMRRPLREPLYPIYIEVDRCEQPDLVYSSFALIVSCSMVSKSFLYTFSNRLVSSLKSEEEF